MKLWSRVSIVVVALSMLALTGCARERARAMCREGPEVPTPCRSRCTTTSSLPRTSA